jgi:hypothetical protein
MYKNKYNFWVFYQLINLLTFFIVLNKGYREVFFIYVIKFFLFVF